MHVSIQPNTLCSINIVVGWSICSMSVKLSHCHVIVLYDSLVLVDDSLGKKERNDRFSIIINTISNCIVVC